MGASIARPWDFFNQQIGRTIDSVAEERFSTCLACPHLVGGKICSKCGCFMSAKVKLPHASCPLGNWGDEEVL